MRNSTILTTININAITTATATETNPVIVGANHWAMFSCSGSVVVSKILQ